jgi:hypothetical protein
MSRERDCWPEQRVNTHWTPIIPLCGKTNIAADGVLLAAVDGLRHDCRN